MQRSFPEYAEYEMTNLLYSYGRICSGRKYISICVGIDWSLLVKEIVERKGSVDSAQLPHHPDFSANVKHALAYLTQ
jgi:hypothetical protein